MNSKGAPLENAELSQTWHAEKQTYSGRHGTKKIKFYMDYFASKLRLIYFFTFSGNRFNPDHSKSVTLELVAAGPQLQKTAEPGDAIWDAQGNASWFSFFQPETTYQRFSLSQPPLPTGLSAECQTQTNSASPATMLGCSKPLLLGGWQWHGKQGCAGASWQILPPLATPALAGSLLILPSPYKTCRWLDVTPGEGRRHGIGDWYQLLHRKICHTWRV